MKKILNIRGCHCSGKTTSVREYINSCNHFVLEENINGLKTSFTVLTGGNVVVLGRYDQSACGGCDRFKGGNHVKRALVYAVNKWNPDVIIYEGIMYSVTYKMATEMAQLSKELGREWKSIYLFREYPQMLEFLNERNNGKPVNQKAVKAKYDIVERVYQKLKANGYNVERKNVTGVPKEELGEYIRKEVQNV